MMGGGVLAVGTEGVGVNSRGETDQWKCDGRILMKMQACAKGKIRWR